MLKVITTHHLGPATTAVVVCGVRPTRPQMTRSRTFVADLHSPTSSRSRAMSYLYWDQPPPDEHLRTFPTHPRPLQRIAPPSAASLTGVPGSESRPFTSRYTRTTHIIPAAQPRYHATGLIEPVHSAGESSAVRKERNSRLAEALAAKKTASDKGQPVEGLSDAPELFNFLDRYALNEPRPRSRQGVTLLLMHANGFPRRIWEPTIKMIMENQREDSPIEEVWTLEAVNHGDGAVLNKDKLGDLFHWSDLSRDILNFVLNFMPSRSGEDLPTCLIPVSRTDAADRERRGLTERQVVGVGHSIGGCTLARAAIECPAPWSAISVIDPVVWPYLGVLEFDYLLELVYGALARKTRWPSKSEALTSFQASPFFKTWDPQVLVTYVNEGICDSEDGNGVRLKQSGFQEACSFNDILLPRETWELLPTLDERIPLLWIMAEKASHIYANDQGAQHTVWRRRVNTSNVRIRGASHLVVQEAPKVVADTIIDFCAKTCPPLPPAKL